MRRLGPALEVREFRLWWLAWLSMGVSLQMIEVAIGWEVYAQHRSALDLGWIGLAEFVPMLVLALPAGHLADRVPRRTILVLAMLLGVGVGVGLAFVSAAGVTSVLPYLALAVGAGVSTAVATPAARALPPTLVRVELLQSAMTLRSIAGQGSQIVGPALGGLLYDTSSVLVYLLAAGWCLAACGCVLAMRPAAAATARGQATAATVRGQATAGTVRGPATAATVREPAAAGTTVAQRVAGADAASPESVLDGLRFVRHTQVLLGAILLDLIAVLFGGVVALLPIYARSILHVGASGLGVLRAAPAIGALLAAVVITRRPIGRRAGRMLLTVVAVYGVSIVVFGFSRLFPLSLVALGVSGFVDLYSMNIRSTTVAIATPDRLRGRVNAVEMVFISASNELGAFESGVAAYLVGTVPAVVGGGVLTIALALSWRRLFPALANVDRLESLAPPEPAPDAHAPPGPVPDAHAPPGPAVAT